VTEEDPVSGEIAERSAGGREARAALVARSCANHRTTRGLPLTPLARRDAVGPTLPGPGHGIQLSKKTRMYQEQLGDFMNKHIYPNEQTFVDQLNSQPTRWQVPPIMEELKAKARERGLWNLFLPESERGAGLTNLDYAPLCEIMGRSPLPQFQLLGLTPGGGARALRDGRTEDAVARAAPGREDPLGLRHDRAQGRLVRRHQHRVRDPA
jgi:hypothetical protein